MRIQRRFDIINVAAILLFIVISTAFYVFNGHIYVLFASFIALTIAALVIRATITRTIVSPILTMSRTSYLMAEGNLDKEIFISSGDELRELAQNFNVMAASLREKMEVLEESVEKEQRVVRELAILNEFTAYMTSELEIELLLQRFIEKTKDLMKTEAGAIIFLGSDGTRTFFSTDGLILEDTVERMLALDSKSIASVIKEQAAVRRNDLMLLISEGRVIRNFVAIPLYSTTGIQCLLAVINSQNGFGQEDEDSLFAFGFQAFQTLALQNEVAKLATTDGLTGLYNNRTFQKRLAEEILRAERYQRNIFLVIIDIDHFKKFNDAYGHQTGDDVLKTIARIMREALRKVDFSARYGGEEFVVILPETSCDRAYTVAERLRKSVMDYPFSLKDGLKIQLTVSAGIACFPEDTTEKEDLVKKADMALYYAKNHGRNRVCLYRETISGQRG